jgi:hypothetical protein
MKRFFWVIAFVCVCASASAQGVPSPSTPRMQIDAAGTLVNTANPLPVSVTGGISIASVTITASGTMDVRITSSTITLPVSVAASLPVTIASDTTKMMSTYQVTTTTATAGASLVSALSGRRFVSISNLGTDTIWINPGGSTATVSSGIPVSTLSYWSDNVTDAVPVAYISSFTQTISVTQGR